MDELLKKVSALGIPGIVFVVVVGSNSFVGAAAFTAALATLGGPLGMAGGLISLGLIGLVSHYMTEIGTDKVIQLVIKKQLETKSKEDIIDEIMKYPISKKLKISTIHYINKLELEEN